MEQMGASGEHELNFSASVNDMDLDAEAVVELRFHEHDSGALSLRLQLLGDEEQRIRTYSKLDGLRWNFCTLYPKAPAEKKVSVFGIKSMTFHGVPVQTVTIDCDAVEVDITDDVIDNDTPYFVTAQLVPSGILAQFGSRTFYPTGEVSRQFGDDRPVEITLKNGSVVARAIFERSADEEFGNAVTKLTERTIITGQITVNQGGSLVSAHEQFRSDLDDVCLLLSLCYRWPVTYYKLEYFDAHSAPANGSFARRVVPPRKRSGPFLHELIHVQNLVDGGLDQLYQLFRQSAARQELERAITYLSHSYATRGLEAAYFTAFAAFETVVAAAEGKKAYALGSKRWDRLATRLSQAIEGFLGDEKIAEPDRTDLLLALAEKLPDVRRISLRRRVMKLVTQLGFDVHDLWPNGFEEGIQRAIAKRNELFHAAKLTEAEILQGDMVRIRVLTERILLNTLQWPTSGIWAMYDQELRWTNKAEPGRHDIGSSA